MTERPQIPANAQLLKGIAGLLEPGEELPPATRLEYWRQREYIPSQRDGWGRGSTLSYPPGTARQVVALMRELRDQRSLDKAALTLFFSGEGCQLGEKALRKAVAHELDAVRIFLEKQAGTWAGLGSRPADYEETAERLAKWFAKGHADKRFKAQRDVMLERLDRTVAYVPDEDDTKSRETLRRAVELIAYGFLSGEVEWGVEDFLVLALVMAGSEEMLAPLLPSEAALRDLVAKVRRQVSDEVILATFGRFTLPHLRAQLEAMATADFEQARASYQPIVEMVLMLWRTILRALPDEVTERLWSLGDFHWRYFTRVASLPLVFEARREGAQQLDGALAYVTEHLDEWRSVLEAATADDSLKTRQENLVEIVRCVVAWFAQPKGDVKG